MVYLIQRDLKSLISSRTQTSLCHWKCVTFPVTDWDLGTRLSLIMDKEQSTHLILLNRFNIFWSIFWVVVPSIPGSTSAISCSYLCKRSSFASIAFTSCFYEKNVDVTGKRSTAKMGLFAVSTNNWENIAWMNMIVEVFLAPLWG